MPLVSQDGDIKTFQQAEQARTQRLSIARGRRAPDTSMIDEAAKLHTYFIYNVGPWPQKINTGSTGWVTVTGCPKDKEYVRSPREIKHIEYELTIKDEYEYNSPLLTKGATFANEVVGIGRNRNPKQALTNYGLFASENQIPNKEELSHARMLLHATCSEIVREARDLYAMDRKAFSTVVKRHRHFVAAEVLNLTDEVWMTEQSPSQRVKCRYCKTMNDEESIICAKCMKPIDMAKFKALEAEDAAYLAAPQEERRTRPDVAERNRNRAQKEE